MLQLQVENYAVIGRVEVEFGPGLNLLTGETGAGKSILIDALGLLLGERASADAVRLGAEKAAITARFDAPTGITKILEEHGIEIGDEELILRREVGANGKGRVFINNQPATVVVLKQLAPALAAIHAQTESLLSFDGPERLRLLDEFANVQTSSVAAAYEKYRELEARIADLEKNEQDRLRLFDLWSFQKNEIEQAHLQPGEDERLETERRVLANAEKLFAAAGSARDALYESNQSACALLRQAEKALEELARYDASFQEQISALDSARIAAEDVAASLRDYAERIHASPARLAEIEDRLAAIGLLKRKYGATLEQVIIYGAEAGRKLAEIENRDQALEKLRRELRAAGDEYLALARCASKKRKEAARKLEKLVEAEINDLAMSAQFKIEISGSEDQKSWTASGFDQAQYLIATNRGESLMPVEKIASGGELSRVMLALKATIEAGSFHKTRTENRELRTLVFDEIDSGIGGRAAEAVGRKLKTLSAGQQVLCITHLPQIACFADQHFLIEKQQIGHGRGARVETTIRRLESPERAQELARMLSGAAITDTSLRHAQQLLKAHA